ncbi:MAG: AtzE family amidohydrolase, partial [Opitutaceae bacterium]|nr:AtzE family amidohydrolase [Opitutaceae bacterium]
MIEDTPSTGALALASAIRTGRITARVVTEQVLDRVAATHPDLNAFTAVTADRARAEAAAVDGALAAGCDPGPLAGVPYAVKNLFDLAGVVTVAGSRIQRSLPPATHDATVVERLRLAGGICIGALNMGEYAYDFVTENAHDGPTRNPHDVARSAGGSSGGCGAAVAAGLVPISIGTDTNGSIRVPSSFCGIWGLKPTYGRLSRAGSFPFVDSLDHVGPFARSVADLAAAYDVLQGTDPRDPACAQRAVDPSLASLDAGLGGLRVATLGGYFEDTCPPPARAAVTAVGAALGLAGGERRIELPQAALARAAAFIITAAEGGQLHLDRLRSQADAFDPACRDRLIAGALLPAAWYLQAQKFRAWYREQVSALFDQVDILIAPATPVPATRLGQQTLLLGGV